MSEANKIVTFFVERNCSCKIEFFLGSSFLLTSSFVSFISVLKNFISKTEMKFYFSIYQLVL